jgi:malonyl CoA-acyl carrier protein transacylase
VSAFGFGGINTHVILEALPAAAAAPPAGAGRPRAATGAGSPAGKDAGVTAAVGTGLAVTAGEAVLRLAAASPQELAEQLEAPESELLERANQEPGPGRCRLAIVAPDQRKVALARKVAARGTPWRGRSDIWFTPSPLLTGAGQVAFLFPGFEPEFAPRLEGVAEAFGLPAPRLRGAAAGPDPRDGVVEHALDVIAVSRLYAAALGEIGITPGVLAGHSLGEWTAMIVAGVYPEIDAFMASIRPGMAEVPDVVYAALGVSADRAAQLAGDSGQVVVTHDNCPHQSVVCGPAAPVTNLVERARAEGILAQPLPFRTGFHSPMYAPYLAAARDRLWRLEVGPASIPVWSATSLAPFPSDPDQLRSLVLRHLVEPVRFRELTQRLHDSGVRAFVQVGPGSLTGFAEDTLAGLDYLTVATTVSRRDGLAQLRRAAAALWAEGLSPRFSRLAPAAAAPSPGVRLRLGGPLVRLTGMILASAPQAVAVGGSGDLPADSPLLAEFRALLTETAAAADAVTRAPAAAQAGRGQAGPGAAGPGAAVPARTMRPAEERTTTREFSLRTMPDIADHCIFPQPDGWPDDSDRFPVVPMTTLLEVLADAALEFSPGRVVTGFDQVTAARWLTVAPPTTARVHATADGADRVRVRIEGYAIGSVLVADAYPAAPPLVPAALQGERPPTVTARELYTANWMFHGPGFAGVADIAAIGDDGIRGAVLSMPARGALLDSVGQLIGHWMQVSFTVDQTVLPTGIQAIRLYGPQPPAGERLNCVAWIRLVTATEMRADAELRTADGRVWCRIEGWMTRRFATDDAIWRVKFHPDRHVLSRRSPDGWCALWERWPDTASRELIMRRYLNAAERACYEQLNPLQQRQWLLARIVVKDAVRCWLWDRGAGPIYPVEITVADAGDKVQVRGPFRAPEVSLAHGPLDGPGRMCAVAMAGPEPVSLSVELAADRTALVVQPGREPQPIDAATDVAAMTTKA